MSHQSSLEKPLESYRDEFPITKKYIYLDHAGVAPVSLRVKGAVEDFLTGVAKAGAFNYASWMERVNQIRERCGELVGAGAEEIAFVKNTSHGLSIIAEGLDWREGDNLIICEKEFPSNIYPWLNLRRKGVEIREVPSRGGRILVQDIERLIDPSTRLLTISSVQFASGYRVDLERVGELCKEKGVLLCVDAIQSLGVIPMNVKEFHVDFLAADGHKWLLAPEGTGILYCKRELAEKINPPLIGWKSIQNESDYDHIDFRLKTNALRFEEGSLNVMGIFALGAAVESLLEVGIGRIENRVLELGDLIIGEAEKRKFHLKSSKNREERGGIVSVLGDFDPFRVKDKLKGQGVMVNVRGGAVRISPHFYNTEDDVLRFFEALDKLLRPI